ncbi:hypothetical protein DFQ27_002474 [Actinomortierella ambigua]|uniref:Uncharacterized protein n=1 Tax=Actinomortierella ambigua TaxID=1343610 RepID=A0A9P6QAA3_9FUNG|nr:hypothetical protein DFQ27_002474 [Actinomortierella ambigua]
MATETVIYVSLALVLLTRIYVFISPPDFLQEHQDPHYQEYHLYRQYHIRKQKKSSPSPAPLSTSTSTSTPTPLNSHHDALLLQATPHAAENQDVSPLRSTATTTAVAAAVSCATTTAVIPTSPSTSSLLSTLAQRNASTATLSPPKEPVPLKPLSNTYASLPPPPPPSSTNSSSSTEQYILERFAHHAPHEELLLVGVGPGTSASSLSSTIGSQAQPRNHVASHSIPRRATAAASSSSLSMASAVDYTQSAKNHPQHGSMETTDDDSPVKWSEEDEKDEDKDEERTNQNSYTNRNSAPTSRSFGSTMPPTDPPPLSTLVFDTPQHLSPHLGPSSSWTTSPHAHSLENSNGNDENNHNSNNGQHHQQDDFEARIKTLMKTMNLRALKPPSYLSLPISEIEYSTSATATVTPITTTKPTVVAADVATASKAITAQFDADPDLQAQIVALRSRHGGGDDDDDSNDSNDSNGRRRRKHSQDLDRALHPLLQQQDMTVVWEAGRWCCLEDNANRLLYVLRKIGWQGHVRVKVLVDRDGDGDGGGGDGQGENASSGLRVDGRDKTMYHRRLHNHAPLADTALPRPLLSTSVGGPSIVAVTEETWKAAGMMEKVQLSAVDDYDMDGNGDEIIAAIAPQVTPPHATFQASTRKQEAFRPLQQQQQTWSPPLSSEDAAWVEERGGRAHPLRPRYDQYRHHDGNNKDGNRRRPRRPAGQPKLAAGRSRQSLSHGSLVQAAGSGVLHISSSMNMDKDKDANTELALRPEEEDEDHERKEGKEDVAFRRKQQGSGKLVAPFSSSSSSTLLKAIQQPGFHDPSWQQQQQQQVPHSHRQRSRGGRRWQGRLQQYHHHHRYSLSHQQHHQQQHHTIATVKPKWWGEGQDTGADADDEVDLREALDEDGVGSDDDDVLVDEEDEVDEDDDDRTDDENEDDGDDDNEDDDNEKERNEEEGDDIQLRQYNHRRLHPRSQKAYTRFPGIRRSHTFPHSFSHYSYSTSSPAAISTTTIENNNNNNNENNNTAMPSSSSSSDTNRLVPISISIPQLSGLLNLGILDRPSPQRIGRSSSSSSSSNSTNSNNNDDDVGEDSSARWSIDAATTTATTVVDRKNRQNGTNQSVADSSSAAAAAGVQAQQQDTAAGWSDSTSWHETNKIGADVNAVLVVGDFTTTPATQPPLPTAAANGDTTTAIYPVPIMVPAARTSSTDSPPPYPPAIGTRTPPPVPSPLPPFLSFSSVTIEGNTTRDRSLNLGHKLPDPSITTSAAITNSSMHVSSATFSHQHQQPPRAAAAAAAEEVVAVVVAHEQGSDRSSPLPPPPPPPPLYCREQQQRRKGKPRESSSADGKITRSTTQRFLRAPSSPSSPSAVVEVLCSSSLSSSSRSSSSSSSSSSGDVSRNENIADALVREESVPGLAPRVLPRAELQELQLEPPTYDNNDDGQQQQQQQQRQLNHEHEHERKREQYDYDHRSRQQQQQQQQHKKDIRSFDLEDRRRRERVQPGDSTNSDLDPAAALAAVAFPPPPYLCSQEQDAATTDQHQHQQHQHQQALSFSSALLSPPSSFHQSQQQKQEHQDGREEEEEEEENNDRALDHELVSSPREGTTWSLLGQEEPLQPLPLLSSEHPMPMPMPMPRVVTSPLTSPRHRRSRRPRLADLGRHDSIPELTLPPPVAAVMAVDDDGDDCRSRVAKPMEGAKEEEDATVVPERRDSGHAECDDEFVGGRLLIEE